MKNGIIAIKEFEGHIIIVVVPLMGQKACGAVLFQDLMNLFTLVKRNAARTIQGESGKEIIMGVGGEFQAIAVDDMDVSTPFGM